jgi:hypothetical protein
MTLAWDVVGGTVVSGQGTGSIVVAWDSASNAGRVGVQRTFAGGCVDSARLDVDVQPFVSVDDEAMQQLMVHPNPADRIVSITSPFAIRSIRVISTTGATVIDRVLNDSPMRVDIDVASLSAGAYTLVVNAATGATSKPLVIHR